MLAAGPETGRTKASVEHQLELSAESLWEEISGRLREALSDGTYSKWFGEVRGLDLDDDTLVLVVPSEFTRDWIESNFLGLIGAAVRDILGGERVVELNVAEDRLGSEDSTICEPASYNELKVWKNSSWKRSFPSKNWTSSMRRTS